MIVIVMGVSGCGKSTVAAQIAPLIDAEFLDADDLHPPENKQLMSAGIPLTDDNRLPWLQTVRDYAADCHANGRSCVIACSALKKSYRDILNEAQPTHYVFLDGKKSLISQRMHKRTGHFMPESLLDSQFAALEPPNGEPNVVSVDIEAPPSAIATASVAALKQAGFL